MAELAELPANIVLAQAYDRAVMWVVNQGHDEGWIMSASLIAAAFNVDFKTVLKDLESAFAGGS